MGLKIVIHTGYQRVKKISLTAMPRGERGGVLVNGMEYGV